MSLLPQVHIEVSSSMYLFRLSSKERIMGKPETNHFSKRKKLHKEKLEAKRKSKRAKDLVTATILGTCRYWHPGEGCELTMCMCANRRQSVMCANRRQR